MNSSTLVVDANIAIHYVLQTAVPWQEQLLQLWRAWSESGVRLCAPRLWISETFSAVHVILKAGQIGPAEARATLEFLEELELEFFDENFVLCQNAFAWANKIGQSKIYDSIYLALAESLNAEFWTADQLLAGAAQKAGAAWVHWVGDC